MGFCYANAPIKHGNYDKQMTSARRNVTLYGIKNCDTVKKARNWLESRRIDYDFHDLRADGLDRSLVNQWLRSVDTGQLLNKRSGAPFDDGDEERLRAFTRSIAVVLESWERMSRRRPGT